MVGAVPDAAEPVGALLSAAYNDLYTIAKRAVEAGAWCKKFCRQLSDNLESFQPLFHEICNAIDQSPLLYLPSQQLFIAYTDRLKEGKCLVQDCLRINRLDLFHRHRYGKAILNLEKDLSSFLLKLSAVNTQLLLRQPQQQLQEPGHDQVQLVPEQTLFLEHKHQIEEVAKEHKLILDDLKERLNLAIEKMDKPGTRPSEITASLQQLEGEVLTDTSTVDGQLTSSLQDTLMIPPFIVGIEHPLKDLKEQLLAKEQIIVGVNGMGGIGKTTLALAVCHDAEVKAFFKEKIHFVTVSQSPNMLDLFKILWQKLVGGLPPQFQNEEDAHRQLHGAIRRSESPVLLVLDDVWSRAHLEKLAFEGEQCRILYTTRQAPVALVKNTFVYNLMLLSEEQALTLFCFSAFGQQSIPKWADASLVNEVQHACGGLPLALKVVGGSLSGQPPLAWQNATDILRAQQIGDYYSDSLLNRLQNSFDVLDAQLQQCFIDLGSFPKGESIPVCVLFDIWTNVHGMEWDDAVMALVELSSRCLVDVVHEYEFGEDMLRHTSAEGIKCCQHDLMRDLALYLGRKAFVPSPKSLRINHEDLQPHLRKWLVMPHKGQNIPNDWQYDSTQSGFSAEIVSLNTDAVAKEDWPHGINFSATQALLLYTDGDTYALPPFVESMSKLKVLLVQSSSKICKLTGFEAFNSLINLESIQLQNVSIPLQKIGKAALPECLRSSKKLQKLYLDQTIAMKDRAFNSLFQLTDFTLIDEFCELLSLQQMSLNGCFLLQKLPDDIGHNLSNLVVLSLRACSNLMALPDSLCKLQQLQHLDMSYCDKIQSLPDDLGQLSNLNYFNLRCCSSLKALPASVTQLQSLEVLLMEGCHALEKIPDGVGKLSKLRKLDLQELPS